MLRPRLPGFLGRSREADHGAVQDVVTRYASQTGHHVERRFGWDCHGLPVEFEIDKKLSMFLPHPR